ncbi:MAG: hypothetical protein ACOCXR_00225 [Phototrophicaceae bacterium]
MSTKAKMQTAQQLIKSKEYTQARAILRTVDHPTAYKWLARLDEIAPEPKKPKKKKKNHLRPYLFAVLAVLAINLKQHYDEDYEQVMEILAESKLRYTCDTYGVYDTEAECEQFAAAIMQSEMKSAVMVCYDLYDSFAYDSVADFSECITRISD